MKETRSMKLSQEETCGPDRFSLKEEVFNGGGWPNAFKVLNQIGGMRDFQGEKIGPIKLEKGVMVDGTDGLDGRDSGRSDLFG